MRGLETEKYKINRELIEQLSMFPDYFMPATDPHGLKLRQRLFVLHYAGNGGNGADAARKAGYAEGSARITASKLLSNTNIQKAIEDRRSYWVEEIKNDQLRTMRLLQAHAHSDIRKLYGENGQLKRVQDLDDETAAAVESIEIRRGKTIVKLTNKASARSDLLKVQGLLNEEIIPRELTVSIVDRFENKKENENRDTA